MGLGVFLVDMLLVSFVQNLAEVNVCTDEASRIRRIVVSVAFSLE
jgi:hypothetical protein